MHWYEDADGNFGEQFQTTGFDARIWELYLFAALSEAGYIIDKSAPAQDFAAVGPLGEFLVEATTVNPSINAEGNVVPIPPTDTEERMPHPPIRPVARRTLIQTAPPIGSRPSARIGHRPGTSRYG